jgi:hypothetical protein
MNDGVNSTVIAGSGNLKADLLALLAKVLIKTPENEEDEIYRRNWFSATLNVEKLLNSVGSYSFLIKIMKDVKSHLDFEPKLPLKKVAKFIKFDFHTWLALCSIAGRLSSQQLFDIRRPHSATCALQIYGRSQSSRKVQRPKA